MLTGTDLLAKVKELGNASKSDLARGCGYVSVKKDGTERINFTAFYEALLIAKGVDVGLPAKGSKGPGGRKLSYLTKVQFNGNLMIGSAYTAQLDLQPGDHFEIKMGRKQITLIPAGAKAEDHESQGCSLPSPAEVSATFGDSDLPLPTVEALAAPERELAVAA
jgi:hypothetical protein